jgi:hypothetical protein
MKFQEELGFPFALHNLGLEEGRDRGRSVGGGSDAGGVGKGRRRCGGCYGCEGGMVCCSWMAASASSKEGSLA